MHRFPLTCRNYNKKGKEKISVKAGTYNCDYLVFNSDEDESVVEYWITDKVSGHTVKYVYTNTEDNSWLKGELIQVKLLHFIEIFCR